MNGKGLACLLVFALIINVSFGRDRKLNEDCATEGDDCPGLSITCLDSGSTKKCLCADTYCEVEESCKSKASTGSGVGDACCADSQCGAFGIDILSSSNKCVAGKCSSGRKLNEDCAADSDDCPGILITCQNSGNTKKCLCADTYCEVEGSCKSKTSTFGDAGDACCSDTQCGVFGSEVYRKSSYKCVEGKCASAGALVACLLSTLSIAVGAWLFRRM